jgi:hypothetical protein
MGQSIVECELLTGTRSAEGIYGQRSREPRSKAEHMAAPTNTADVKKSLANLEPSTQGPEADVQQARENVCLRGKGRHQSKKASL